MSRHKLEQADVITWASVHNIIPIASIVITVIIVFTTLQSRVEVLREKVDRLEDEVKALRGDVRGVATGSAELTPTITETPTPTRRPTTAATPKIGDVVGPDNL